MRAISRTSSLPTKTLCSQSRCLARRQFSRTTRCSASDHGSLPIREIPVPKLDPVMRHRLYVETQAYYKRRSYYAATGLVLGMIAIGITASFVPTAAIDEITPGKEHKCDDGGNSSNRTRGTVTTIDPGLPSSTTTTTVSKLGESVDENADVVVTGTSKVPTFPRRLAFVDDEDPDRKGDEYTLLGLGIRTVSFLGIEVYVVGLYIANDDIDILQRHLVKLIVPTASTLVPSERESLKAMLLSDDAKASPDGKSSEDIWNQVLKEGKIRSLIRIVPTRDTDFAHMRDAWVRHLTARARGTAIDGSGNEFSDEIFGQRVQEFKTLFAKGKSVPKGKEMILARDAKGDLAVWYDDGKGEKKNIDGNFQPVEETQAGNPIRLGGVKDERISRALWLNYLAGENVASKGARNSIVDGIMHFVERPVGTVAGEVVVV